MKNRGISKDIYTDQFPFFLGWDFEKQTPPVKTSKQTLAVQEKIN